MIEAHPGTAGFRCAFLLSLLLTALTWLNGQAIAQAPPPTEAFIARRYRGFSQFQVSRYELDPRYGHIVVGSDFRTDSLRLPTDHSAQIVRIDLVYTAYRQNEAFDQQKLNLSRLARLAEALPGVLTDSSIVWNLMEQTGCTDATGCRDYLHGFVIYTEKRYTKTDNRVAADSLTRRLRHLDAAIKRRKVASRPQQLACHPPVLAYSPKRSARRFRRAFACPTLPRGTIRFRFTLNPDGTTKQVELPGYHGPCAEALTTALRQAMVWEAGFQLSGTAYESAVEGIVRSSAQRRHLRFTKYALTDTALARKNHLMIKKNGCFVTPPDLIPLDAPEEVVSRVFNRNPGWKQSLVVVDVTGSMTPYLFDLMAWLRLTTTTRNRRTFVFFNDGDDTEDSAKKIGRTGGLYPVQTADFEDLIATMRTAMNNGGGGDLPENNGEALLKGFELLPHSDEAILIADNHAFPRDSRLLAPLAGRNVRLILCGTAPGVNPAYLDLARKYRFSVHTIGSDLTSLYRLHEGEKITIDGIEYEITPDGFRTRRLGL